MQKKYQPPKYEFPIHDINWTTGVGRPAGIYWLAGRSMIAAHDSAAEALLLEQGAILVATIRFDGRTLESTHRHVDVELAAARQVATDFFLSAAN